MWEYETVVCSLKGGRTIEWFREELNRLGAEGWEAVGVTTSAVMQPAYVAVLKRQASPPPDSP